VKKGKVVSDPVHGSISLNQAELGVINTPEFQRLRNVKQLGLAHMVFPGADYSRFSHSLGVCHVTGLILDALRRSGQELSEDEEIKFRLAGLLHDVGHYPYSHAMEDAIDNHYSGLMFEDRGTAVAAAAPTAEIPKWLNHEAVGKELLQTSPTLLAAIDSSGCKPAEIYEIFTREKPQRFANLISSDLDADRIDYLLRTAHHTGLPYARVDLQYMLTQMRVDADQNICIHPKALRTVDHFLLGRFFDYQQVVFNKTVVALELVLKDVLQALLQEGVINCSTTDVQKLIGTNAWADFDDAVMLERMRDLRKSTTSEALKLKILSILDRRPAKLVAHMERLANRNETEAKNLLLVKKIVVERLDRWAEKFGIDRELWYVWSKAGVALTKIGARVSLSALVNDDASERDYDKAAQSVHILNTRNNTSKPVMEIEQSLMSVLSEHALYALRVYVVLPSDREGDRARIAEHIRADLGDISWL
jgi:uncharacterized protein